MKNPFLPALLMVVLAAYCSLHGLSSAAVISIDFGSEWIKVALVKVSGQCITISQNVCCSLKGLSL